MVGGGTGTTNMPGNAVSWVPMFNSARTTTEITVQQALATAGTLSRLFVRLDAAPGTAGSGRSFTVTVRRNGAATTVTCAILDTATGCADTTNTATFAAGDLIAVHVAPSATAPTARALRWTAQFSAAP